MDHRALNQCDLCDQLSYSCSRISVPTAVCAGLYALLAAVVLVTVCGNLLVIISICCFKHLQTPTNLIVLSLAVTDFLMGLIVMPFYFSLLVESCWYLGVFACKLFSVWAAFLTCVSTYSVAFIAVDRYLALHSPFLYGSKMTVSVSMCVVGLIWAYSLVYNLVLCYLNGSFNSSDVCVGECVAPLTEIWTYVDLVCVFVLTGSVIMILYAKIFAIAKRHISAISKHSSRDNKRADRSAAAEAKVAVTLGVVVVVFLLCYTPYAISVFVSSHNTDVSVSNAVKSALALVLLNSTVNPILYALLHTWFKKSVRHILTCLLCNPQSALLR